MSNKPVDEGQQQTAEQQRAEQAYESVSTQTESDTEQPQSTPADSAEAASLQEELAELKAALNDKEEEVLRVHAEMENLRRRSEKDIQAARKFALERFVEALLPVVDSLELGLDAAAKEGATLEKIREGDEITLNMLIQALEKHGVSPVNPKGEKFNPDVHQAMSAQPHDGEPDHVLDVMQKGYVLNDRVVRPALVVVSKPQ